VGIISQADLEILLTKTVTLFNIPIGWAFRAQFLIFY